MGRLVAAVVGVCAVVAAVLSPVVVSPARADSGSISVTSATFTRVADGRLGWDVTVVASGFQAAGGICSPSSSYQCVGNLDVHRAQDPVGTWTNVDYHLLSNSAEPSVHFQYQDYSPKIDGYRIRYAPYPSVSSSPAASATFTTTQDPYPLNPGVSLGSPKIVRLSDGRLRWQVTVTAAGFAQTTGVCGYTSSCRAALEFHVTGNPAAQWTELDYRNYLGAGSGEPSVVFDYNASVSRVDRLRVHYTSSSGPAQQFAPSGRSVSDLTAANLKGGGDHSNATCPCSVKDPVNTATGEFFLPATDLSLPGSGDPVAVTRTYSSVATVDGPFGFGWTSNLTARLDLSAADGDADGLPDSVRVIQANGAESVFDQATDHTYPSPVWKKATLVRVASTGGWVFTLDHSDVYAFSAAGVLQSSTDLHGNTVNFAHDSSGRVTTVTGSGSRSITLTWSGAHVSAVSDSATRTVGYGYDTAGNLTTVTGVDGTTWTYGYDSVHRMTTLTRPRGGATTNVYDTANRVTSQTDAVGRATSFSYSDFATSITEADGTQEVDEYTQGAPSRITRAAGTALQQVTSYDYDEAMNPVAVTDPLGTVTRTTFDNDHHPLTTTDPLGRVTTRTFNGLGEPLSVTDPAGRVTSMTYNAAGDLLSTTSPGSHTTSFAYNTNGTLASTTDAAGKVTSVTYNAAGLPLCTTDPDARQRCVAYNSAGFMTSSTDAASKATTLTVDAAGRVLTSKDPLNRTTTFVYDGDGNRTKVTDPLTRVTTSAYNLADELTSVTDPALQVTTYGYDNRGRRTTVTDPLGHPVTAAYDGLSRTTSVTDALSRATSYIYDADDRVLTTTTPTGAVTTNAYDPAGQLTSSTDPLGKTTTNTYDLAGRLSSSKDPLGRVTSRTYVPDGQVDTVTLPDASTLKSTWDVVGRQLTRVNADGKTTTYTYDPAGLVTKKVEPGAMTTSYTYDTAGRLSTTTRPDTTVVTNTYDAAGQLTTADYPGTADDVTYTYKADGARATMVDRTGTTTYTYGTTGLTTKIVNGATTALSYGYDAASRLTSVTYPGTKQVTYTYDNADQMTKVTDWGTRATTFTWTPDGQLATQTSPNGVVDTRTYDTADQLTQIADKKGTTAVGTFGYGYDAAGQLTSATINGTTRTYGYDLLGQLGATSAGTYTATAAGLLTKLANGATQAYNTAQQLTSQTPTTGPVTSYGYNANGSRTTTTIAANGSIPAQTTTYGYDASGDLASATTAGGTTVTYTADGDGLRQTRTTGGTTTKLVWNTAASLPQLLDDGTNSYIYGPTATPVEQVATTGGAVAYLHADNLGSVRAITDTNGTLIGTADYDAYGKRTTTGTATPIGYTGNLTDPTTTLVYLRARDYDPTTGQFLQVDPALDQTHQPYTYTANDPLNATDPTGLCLLGGDNPALCHLTNSLLPAVSPIAASVISDIDCANGGKYDAWTCTVMTFDPVYAVLDGYGREIKDAQAGCSGWQIAADGIEGVMGVAGTASIALGGASAVGVLRSGSIAGGVAAADGLTEVGFRSDTSHIFRKASGHLAEDTVENRSLIKSAINPASLRGSITLNDGATLQKYFRTLPDGTQVWAEVRNGIITNGGVNVKPRS